MCPDPLALDVILPKLFLPPDDAFPFVKDLKGDPFQRFFLSTRIVPLTATGYVAPDEHDEWRQNNFYTEEQRGILDNMVNLLQEEE